MLCSTKKVHTGQWLMCAEVSYLYNEGMHSVFFPVNDQVGHEKYMIGTFSHCKKHTFVDYALIFFQTP